MTRKKTAPPAADTPAPEEKSGKHPGGRPSDYDFINLEQVRKLAARGLTDVEMADFFGCAVSTWYLWKKEHPEFSEAVKLGKDEADRKVEASLYECATTGAICQDTHFAVIDGKVIATPYVRQHKPDNTAQIFWLKNRKPGSWRDKTEVQDDRLTALLAHMNRNQGGPHGQESTHPPARGRPGPGIVRPGGGINLPDPGGKHPGRGAARRDA